MNHESPFTLEQLLETVEEVLRAASSVRKRGELFFPVVAEEHPVYVRVEKAKNLLLNPNYYITEIASELGYESLSHFNQAFKRMVGEPPHAYRTRLPSRIGCVVEMG